MNNSTVYVGMDVNKDSFHSVPTLQLRQMLMSQQKKPIIGEILKYLEFLRSVYVNNVKFVCGYEAGCLGQTSYHQLTERNVNCVIIAPTMLKQHSMKRSKIDKHDAEIITRCLSQRHCSTVHILTYVSRHKISADDERSKTRVNESQTVDPRILSAT